MSIVEGAISKKNKLSSLYFIYTLCTIPMSSWIYSLCVFNKFPFITVWHWSVNGLVESKKSYDLYLLFLTVLKNGELFVKPKPQNKCRGLLYIAGEQSCDFIIWITKDLQGIHVTKNQNLGIKHAQNWLNLRQCIYSITFIVTCNGVIFYFFIHSFLFMFIYVYSDMLFMLLYKDNGFHIYVINVLIFVNEDKNFYL